MQILPGHASNCCWGPRNPHREMLSPRNSPPNNTPRSLGTKSTGFPSSITHSLPLPHLPQTATHSRAGHKDPLSLGYFTKFKHYQLALCARPPPGCPRSPGSPKTIQQQPLSSGPESLPSPRLPGPLSGEASFLPPRASGHQGSWCRLWQSTTGPQIAQRQVPKVRLPHGRPSSLEERGGSPMEQPCWSPTSPHGSPANTRAPSQRLHLINPPQDPIGRSGPDPGLSFPKLETRLLTPSPPCSKP